MTEEKAKSLIGKKVRGFKFESNDVLLFTPNMKNYIGISGKIIDFEDSDFLVRFEDNSYYYPASLIEAHLVEEDWELNIEDLETDTSEIEQLKADKEDILGLLEAYIFELDNGQFEFFNKYGFNISELSNKFRQTLEKHGK